VFHTELSIDEAMIRYFGHHGAKQFIRGKPVRYGFKEWMLCSSVGYCYYIDPYCGKNSVGVGNREDAPLGTKVILSCLEIVQNPRHHRVFFDNFFTSYDLLTILTEKGFEASGTV
jgi:hypothetical protein